MAWLVCSEPRFPWTKESRANADLGRAFLDSLEEVLAHAHGQHAEVYTRERSRQGEFQVGHLPKSRARVAAQGRHSHQPLDAQSGLLQDGARLFDEACGS